MSHHIPTTQARLKRGLTVGIAGHGNPGIRPDVGDLGQFGIDQEVLQDEAVRGPLGAGHGGQCQGGASGGDDDQGRGGVDLVDQGADHAVICDPVHHDRVRILAQEVPRRLGDTTVVTQDDDGGLLHEQHSTQEPTTRLPAMASEAWTKLRDQIQEKAVVRGKVILSSGREADYYVDLRRVTLDAVAAPLVGRVMRELVEEWEFDAVGGLTLGADPVATAMLHSAAADLQQLDAFVVRKAEKQHGLQRRIEGPDVAGRRVLAVEDTSTTGGSVLTAVDALQEAGATVVGVAVIVDRGAGPAIIERGLKYKAAYSLADLGLE